MNIIRLNGYAPEDIDIFVGCSGSAYPQRAGIMPIDNRLYNNTSNAVGGSEHAAKPGVLSAYGLCMEQGGRM